MTHRMFLDGQLDLIVGFFSERNFDYALAGAMALNAYGYCRSTRDVDLVTCLEYQNELIRFLESKGFETLYRSEAFSSHLMQGSSVRFDFVYVDGPTGDAIFREAKEMAVFQEGSIRVVSVMHLIALKLFAARNDPGRKIREIADILELMKLNPVDRSEVESLLKDYGLESLAFMIFGEE